MHTSATHSYFNPISTSHTLKNNKSNNNNNNNNNKKEQKSIRHKFRSNSYI